MNVNANRSPRPNRMEEAPGTRPGEALRSPSEVLTILEPGRQEPPAILIGGLWKTGPLPQGAIS